MVSSRSSKRSRRGRPGSAGLTVIEVAIALAVLSIGLLSLVAVIPLAKTDLRRSGQRTEAVFVAQETAEWLRGMAYDDDLLSAGDHTVAEDSTGGVAVAGYSQSWAVEDNAPLTGVKRVTVLAQRTTGGDESAQIVFLHAEVGR